MTISYINCPHPQRCGVTRHVIGSTDQQRCSRRSQPRMLPGTALSQPVTQPTYSKSPTVPFLSNMTFEDREAARHALENLFDAEGALNRTSDHWSSNLLRHYRQRKLDNAKHEAREKNVDKYLTVDVREHFESLANERGIPSNGNVFARKYRSDPSVIQIEQESCDSYNIAGFRLEPLEPSSALNDVAGMNTPEEILSNVYAEYDAIADDDTFLTHTLGTGDVVIEHAASGIRLRVTDNGNGFLSVFSKSHGAEAVEELREGGEKAYDDPKKFYGLGIGTRLYEQIPQHFPGRRIEASSSLSTHSKPVRARLHEKDPYLFEGDNSNYHCAWCVNKGIVWKNASPADFANHPH